MDELISVIIPVYNCEAYIDKCIHSVLNQTYENVEVIVVDDGSTDDTSYIIEKHNEFVKCIRQNNLGPSAARNRGVKVSSGKYIAFLDADDMWNKWKLEDQIKCFGLGDKVGMVFSNMEISKSGKILEQNWIERMNADRFLTQCGIVNDVYKKLVSENFIPTCSVLLSRECFDDVQGFDETLKVGEDWNLWLKISKLYSIVYTGVLHGTVTRDKDLTHYDWHQYFSCFIKVMERESINSRGEIGKIIDKNLSLFFFNLGYNYLHTNKKVEAKKALIKSIKKRINLPAIKSYLLSFLT